MPIYTMNIVSLVFFVLVIIGGIVNMGFEVFGQRPRSTIAVVFFFTVAFLGLADLYYVIFGGVGSSLSAWIVSHGGGQYGFWKFAIGCVVGHLFFPMQEIKS